MSFSSIDGLLALCGSLTGLSTIAVGLRVYCRKQQQLRLLSDDWTACAGVLSYVGSCALVFYFVRIKGLGLAADDIPKAQIDETAEASGKGALAFDLLNTTTLACIKASAVLLYRRVFRTGVSLKEWINIATLVTAMIILIWYALYVFLALFQCGTHIDDFWNGHFARQCPLNVPWATGIAATDFAIDLWVLILPIPPIWCLRAPMVKRMSIIGIFLPAFAGLGASIARIVIYAEFQEESDASSHKSNPEREQTKLVYIQMLESGMQVTAVNLPSLWSFCTSTVPQGLKSLRSLLESSRTIFGRVDVMTSAKDVTTGATRAESASSNWNETKSRSEMTTRDPVLPYMLSGRVESMGNEAYAVGNSQGRGRDNVANDFMGIRVQTDIEVTCT